MCLGRQLIKEQQSKFLRGRKTITCWKVVRIRQADGMKRFFPIFFKVHFPYDRENICDQHLRSLLAPAREGGENDVDQEPWFYKPYYHFLTTRQEARKYKHLCRGWDDIKIIKCEVDVADITTIGKEGSIESIESGIVVVASRFKIIGEDKYFPLHKENPDS